MKLRLLAAMALVALVTLFLVKGAATIRPGWFDGPPLDWATATARLTASLLMLLFFTGLRAELEGRGRQALAAAATIGMAGAGIGALVDLRVLLVSVDLAEATHKALAAGALGDAASVAALVWFLALWRARSGGGALGTGLAITGAALLGLLALTAFALLVSGVGLDWLWAWSYAPALALLAVAVFAVAALARFFVLITLDPALLVGEPFGWREAASPSPR